MNRYLIIEVKPNGKKNAYVDYKDYNDACKAQEILENRYTDCAYLIYTADEWVTECDRNA